MNDHPFGWLSLLPPFTAIVLAIVTRRVVVSLLLGILMGALVLRDWNFFEAVGHMCSDHLWSKLIDSDMLHVFFFTLLMGIMVGMINRAAGMRGLVNALTPIASNRKRGQITTWFLGLFVFFDDYANTVLLGNTLKPLTDRLKIAREKLAYLVDSTAAPVAGLALISTWVAGELDFVKQGLSQLPVEEEWNAFGVFVQSIPYRFYVLFALLFVPIVAWLGRDFGPMLKAEQRAIKGEGLLDPAQLAEDNDRTQDATAPNEETPARWFNAVIPVAVTVGAVLYFLYTSGKEGAESDSLRDIFGNADSYSSLLWGALWGAGTAYVLIAAQRLISFRELHAAGAAGGRLMVPALLVLWLAQSMSSMTRNQDFESPSQEAATALASRSVRPSEILTYVTAGQNAGEQEAATVLFAAKTILQLRYQEYQKKCSEQLQVIIKENSSAELTEIKAKFEPFEKKEWDAFQSGVAPVTAIIKDHASLKDFVLKQMPEDKREEHESSFDFAGEYSSNTDSAFSRWPATVDFDKLQLGEISAAELEDALLKEDNDSEESTYSYPHVEYHYVHRSGKLYTGGFLSSKMASLREGNGFVANNFVALLPTMVFILASIVAFATGTSWGTMGIVMPLVIPLAYSQLAFGGDAAPGADNPIMLCCIGSVLAGAIFGDHCSPISDTTVLSSQASGCDHVAHVRTQLPYAVLVGLVSIVCGTLPIGYGVPVWLLIPIGIAGIIGLLLLLGTKVDDDAEANGDEN